MIDYRLEVQLPLSNSKKMLGAPLSTLMRWLRHTVIPERQVNPWHRGFSLEERKWLELNGFVRRGQILRLKKKRWTRYTEDHLTRFRIVSVDLDFWYHRSELGRLPVKAPGERIRYGRLRPKFHIALSIPVTPLYEIDKAHVTKKTLEDYRREYNRAMCRAYYNRRKGNSSPPR